MKYLCICFYFQRCFDWEATAGILNGVYLTIDRHPYIAYFPNLKVKKNKDLYKNKILFYIIFLQLNKIFLCILIFIFK